MELLVYKASAGSGKTFTLAVEYIKHLIENPRAYRQILAVTFTNKATAEMKERIVQQLYGIWKGDRDSEAYLNRIREDLKEDMDTEELRKRAGMALQYMLHDYSRFRVETIDSFFQSVMRNLARELELTPNLNIELNNTEVLDEAVDSLIEKLTPDAPVMGWLLDYINERIADDKRWNVSDEIKSFGRNIFDESYLEKGGLLRECLKEPQLMKLYKEALKELETEALEQMKAFNDQFEGELEGYGLAPEDLKNGSRGIGSYFRKLRDGRLSDKDVVNATLQGCLANADNWSTKSSKQRKEITALAERSLMPLLQEAERMRPQRCRTVNSCRLTRQHLNKLQLLNHIDEEVKTLNREQNRFLLSDTNALLHRLVREGDSSFVFEKIGASIRNVMIDEFQDTSRMQWDNFRLLLLEGLAQGEDSLIVGDVKQSIYRWRNGDWRILNGLKKSLGHFPIRLETLKVNRRSEANVTDFNNRVFREVVDYLNSLHLAELKTECRELKEAYEDVEQESAKEKARGYVRVEFLEPDEERDYTEATLQALGEAVEELLAEGVKLNDMAILVRKNKNIAPIADYFDRELKVPVVSDEAFRLDASQAVCMLVDALRYLSDATDGVALASLVMNYRTGVKEQEGNTDNLLAGDMEKLLPEGTEADAPVRTAGGVVRPAGSETAGEAGRLSLCLLRRGNGLPAEPLVGPGRISALLGRETVHEDHPERRAGRHPHLVYPQVERTGIPHGADPLLRLENGKRNEQPAGVVLAEREALQRTGTGTGELFAPDGRIGVSGRLPGRAAAAVGGQPEPAVRGLYACGKEPAGVEPEGTTGNHGGTAGLCPTPPGRRRTRHMGRRGRTV